jgi:GEVED domain/Secretion system C-terminal sorting domain/PKD domain
MKKNVNTFLIIVFALFISINSTAQLANWTQTSGANFPTNNVGQINGMTRISQLKHHPTDSLKMYAVTAEGGYFTTTDKGNNWAVKAGTENLTGSCASICIDVTNEQNVLLGTGDANYYSNGQGILKSTNGGTSFIATSLTNCLVVHIIQNPLNSTQYIAATNKGIYKSTNSGANWTAKTATTLQFVDMRMNPGTNSQTLYACTKDNNPRLYKSFDFGDTWTELIPGFTYAAAYTTGGARIGLTAADTSVVYYEIIGGGGIIYKSNDGGATFNSKKVEGFPFITFYDQNGPTADGLTGQGNYNNCIWVDKTNPAKLWLQSHNTWYSIDSGATWTQLTHWASKVHTDMHQIEQAPFNNNLLITCSDGGVWFSTDAGNNWTPKTNGIGAFEIATNAGISAMTDKDFVSIGTQDNARLYGTAAGWVTISGGDDYAKRVADFNGFIYYDGNSRQANLVGGSATYALPTANWNAFAFNRTNVNLGFMGVNDVWRTTNLSVATPTWAKISTFNTAISSMHSCIADANILYVLLTNGDVYVSTNALAASPIFATYFVPSSASSTGSIVAMANNANIVYIQENNKVYRSSDGGQTWVDNTYNLPNVNHRRIVAEQFGGTTELVFVGTNNAVYYKKAGQTSWTNYSTNLPGRRSPTEISMFDNGTNQSKLRYATYGRSMWETKFGNLRQLNVSFDAAQTYYCTPNQSVQFRDQSTGNITSWSWSFPGGTPSTSTVQNPTVTYATGGVYSATLTVSDGVSSNTITIPNYITVLSSAPKANTGCALTSNSNLSNPYGIGISSFSLGTISSITSNSDGFYNDYSCSQFTNLTPGTTYNATITTGTTNAEGAQVYIDWNDNGNLEATEAVISYPANTNGTRTLSFTVPTTGVVLNKGLRLRIVSRFSSTPTNACNTSTYGQAEDYTVYVQPTTAAVLSNGTGSANICGTGAANLKVTITGGTSPYTVIISDGTATQTISSYTSGSNISVSPTATTTYSVVSVMDNVYYSLTSSGTAIVTVSQPSVNAPQTATACNSYTWSVNNVTYTTGGTKTAAYTNVAGCDSSYTLNLTINTSTSSSTNQTACNSYTWNGTTYTTSGTYTRTFVGGNSKGCDSVATLNLTINTPPTVSITGGTAVCATTATSMLTANVTGSTPLTYTWQVLTNSSNTWSNVGATTTYAANVSTPTQHRLLISNSCGNATSNIQSVAPIAPPNSALTPSPIASVCNGSTHLFTAFGNTGSNTFEFFSGATSLQNSATSTYTTPILTAANNGDSYTVKVTNKPTFDGNISENFWGSPFATSTGGATSSFGAGHELNAIYVRADAANFYFAIAGNVQANNRILLFIDSKSGGYNNGDYGRTGIAAANAIHNFNSGTTFDVGFAADYCLGIGTDATNYFFDLYTLAGTASGGGGTNTYLGSNIAANAGYSLAASPANSSQTRGFEMAIPKSALGYTSGDIQIMAMYSADAAGFLSNQFLTQANIGAGSYGSNSITFSAATPNQIIIPADALSTTCSSTSIATVVTVTPCGATWNGTVWTPSTPTSTINAIIASSVVPTGSFVCQSLTINSGVSLTTTGITATINGDIINNGTGIAGTGNVVINSNSTISGNAISFNGALTVNTGATLTTAGLFTLASNATNTAKVANSAGIINGLVTVERYMPSKRAWRFLTCPLSSNGISAVNLSNSWQTQTYITGPSGTGLDGMSVSPRYSFQTFSTAANNWININNTTTTALFNSSATASTKGFAAFIMGDRTPSNLTTTTSNNTTLSATGKLLQGTQTFALGSLLLDDYALIGNPYASPIDVDKVYLNAGTNNITRTFYTWDPLMGGTTSTGGYISISYDGAGSYDIVPNTTAQTQHIQSGQSFFVQTPAAGNTNVTFEESNKSNNSTNMVFGVANNKADKLFINLQKNSNTVDGVLGSFATGYSKSFILTEDAEKFYNNEEGISLVNGTDVLSINRRPYVDAIGDTLYLSLHNLIINTNYALAFTPQNWDAGMQAVLIDKLLNIATPIDLYNNNNLLFTSTTTSAANRFIIVIKAGSILPNYDITLFAQFQDNKGILNFTIAQEQGIKHYVVERGIDGKIFKEMSVINATNKGNYSIVDNKLKGINYYRIKAILNNGEAKYSNVKKLSISNYQLSIYPNPAKDLIIIEGKGIQQIEITDMLGREVYKSIENKELSKINCKQFAKGSYIVTVTTSQGKESKTIIKE